MIILINCTEAYNINEEAFSVAFRFSDRPALLHGSALSVSGISSHSVITRGIYTGFESEPRFQRESKKSYGIH